MIFLLGVGAAAGAYVTGAVDYLSQHNYFLNNIGIPQSGVVLRVSDVDQARPACPARYSVENRSARRLIIVFGNASAYGAGSAYTQPSLNDYARYGYSAAAAPQVSPAAGPVAGAVPVEPGQQRLVSALDAGGDVYGAGYREAVACMDEPPVTLQLTDCASDAAGICNATGAAASPPNPGAPNPQIGAVTPQGYPVEPSQTFEAQPQSDQTTNPGFEAPPQSYPGPALGYEPQGPTEEYGAPSQAYHAPHQRHGAPPQDYQAPPPPGHDAPPQGHEAPPQGYGAPPPPGSTQGG